MTDAFEFKHIIVTGGASYSQRFAIDPMERSRDLDWQPTHTGFFERLRATIAWYCGNVEWRQGVKEAAETKYVLQGQ